MIYPAAIKHLSLLLTTSPCFMTNSLVESTPCGRWYSSDCFAKSDKRYDASYSNTIRDQDPLLADLAGFWKATVKSYDSNDQPIQPIAFDPANLATLFGLPYKSDTKTEYVNITVSGSRYYEHRYSGYGAATQEFCDNPLSSFSAQNVLSNGTCGVNGYATWGETYSTSSHEKDGTLKQIGGALGFSNDKGYNPASGIVTSIGEDTIFSSSYGTNQGGFAAVSKVCTFMNKAKTKAEEQQTTYNTVGEESTLIGYKKLKYVKISKAQFSSGIEDMWESYNVQEKNRGALPMGECLGTSCPTEEEWCVTDPNCSKSPYQEPEGVARAEVIAGFTVAGAVILIVILIAVLYKLHLRAVKNQKEEIRQTLMKGIAGGAHVGFTQAGLSMDDLVGEFMKIDTSNDGFVQKSEMKEFAQSGEFGELSEKDFELMFETIDANRNGEIDFVEFVTFIGQCPKKEVGIDSDSNNVIENDQTEQLRSCMNSSVIYY